MGGVPAVTAVRSAVGGGDAVVDRKLVVNEIFGPT